MRTHISKMMIMLIMIMLFVNNAHAQEVSNPDMLKEQYLKKGERQKTAAWITLTAGATMVVVGTVVFLTSWEDYFWSDSSNAADAAGYVSIAGIVVSLVSVPLFISAHSNKKKAAALSVGYQHIYNAGPDMMISQKAMPSLTIRITF